MGRGMQRWRPSKGHMLALSKRQSAHLLGARLGSVIGMRLDVPQLMRPKQGLDLLQIRQPLMATAKSQLGRLMNLFGRKFGLLARLQLHGPDRSDLRCEHRAARKQAMPQVVLAICHRPRCCLQYLPRSGRRRLTKLGRVGKRRRLGRHEKTAHG